MKAMPLSTIANMAATSSSTGTTTRRVLASTLMHATHEKTRTQRSRLLCSVACMRDALDRTSPRSLCSAQSHAICHPWQPKEGPRRWARFDDRREARLTPRRSARAALPASLAAQPLEHRGGSRLLHREGSRLPLCLPPLDPKGISQSQTRCSSSDHPNAKRPCGWPRHPCKS